MCMLLQKARKDYDTYETMYKINDEWDLDVCCYHLQQAIEKVLKCSIELRGHKYSYKHTISLIYAQYLDAGWDELPELEMMAGTITQWESDSRYRDSLYATHNQVLKAAEIYKILEKRLVDYLKTGNIEKIDCF